MKFSDFIKTFLKSFFSNPLTIVALGAVVFVTVLVTTLNLIIALMAWSLFCAVAVFQKSFSKGWLFLMGILLIFPSVRAGNKEIVIFDIFLIILALTGSLTLFLETKCKRKYRKKRKGFKSSFFVIILILLSLAGVIINALSNIEIAPTLMTISLFGITFLIFRYFFQTLIRIKRFFSLLIFVGVVHSLIGIIAFSSGWQSSEGMGISAGRLQNLAFNNISYQVNGLLGDGFVMKVGESALAPLLLITIFLTIGFLLTNKKRNFSRNYFEKPRMIAKTITKNIDSVCRKRIKQLERKVVRRRSKKRKKILFRNIFLITKKIYANNKFLLLLLLLVQLIALIFTFSYISLVILGVER